VIRFDFKGIVELVTFYNAADLCILPSRIEAYGLVPREAMLCRTPALVSDIAALRLIEPALKAKLNVKDFQEQIDRFFSMSKKQREDLGKESRESIIKENSYEILKEQKKELLLS
jgi:D-inositol-3-phosphate glycosyltransferase